MSRPLILRLLLALALAFAGGAAQLHALAHAQADLAAVSGGGGHKAPAPLKHSSEQCLFVHALDGAAVASGALLPVEDVSHSAVPHAQTLGGESLVVAFRSRAPPESA